MTHPRRWFRTALAAVPLAVMGAAPSAAAQPAVNAVGNTAAIVVDGAVAEWPEDVYILADAEHVALRFQLEAAISIGAAPLPVQVLVDLDGDRTTGMDELGLGAEVEIVFSDPTSRGRWGPQTKIHRLTDDGRREELSATDLGLLVAPSHASDWFEIRMDRRPAFLHGAGAPERPEIAFRAIAGGRQPRQPGGGVIKTPAPSAALAKAPADATIPAKPDGAVRVMSWNVLWTQPQENPEPFARVLAAVRPDVILFQEWDRDGTSDESIASWLNDHAGALGSWTAETTDGWGVGVATHHRLSTRGPDGVMAPGARWDFPVRLAAATVTTPLGDIVFGSTHLKCCGNLSSDEDLRRSVEAAAINETLETIAGASGTSLIVLGGDFNLVGSPAILSVATTALDADGSALDVADARHVGDPGALYTFVGRRDRPALPPRLDYITYPGAALTTANAFVLHTPTISTAALSAMGLEKDDTWASDHLPVVVDLVGK